MIISFSKKHAILLLIALIIFSFFVYIFLRSISDAQDVAFSSDTDISGVARTPVENYDEVVSGLMAEWQINWEKANDTEFQIKTVDDFQISLQEIIIKREDQDRHLELVLQLSKLKNALKNSNRDDIKGIVNALFSN